MGLSLVNLAIFIKLHCRIIYWGLGLLRDILLVRYGVSKTYIILWASRGLQDDISFMEKHILAYGYTSLRGWWKWYIMDTLPLFRIILGHDRFNFRYDLKGSLIYQIKMSLQLVIKVIGNKDYGFRISIRGYMCLFGSMIYWLIYLWNWMMLVLIIIGILGHENMIKMGYSRLTPHMWFF